LLVFLLSKQTLIVNWDKLTPRHGL